MKQKYCPYCDQKMTSGLYCKGCRRIVLHPYEQDVDYYLNERHPQDDAGCLYHGTDGEKQRETESFADTWNSAGVFNASGSGKKGTAWEKMAADTLKHAGKQAKKYLEQGNSRRPEMTDQSSQAQRKEAESSMRRVMQERRRKNPLTGPAIIFVIWLVIAIGGNVFFAVRHAIRNSMDEIGNFFDPSGSGWESSDVTIPAFSSESGDLSDEEVKAQGENCSSYGHYAVNSDEVSDLLEDTLSDYGLTDWTKDTYSYNYKSGDSTWYSTDLEYALNRDGKYIGTITVLTDTATGELHGLSVSGTEETVFYEMADVIEAVMREFGFSETEESGQDLYREILNREDRITSHTETGTNALTTDYGPEMFASWDDVSGEKYYSMEIYAPGYYTENSV